VTDAPQARVVVIGGANGSGKSTTAPLLLRGVLGVSPFVNPDDLAAELRLSDPHAGDLAAARELVRRLDDLEQWR